MVRLHNGLRTISVPLQCLWPVNKPFWWACAQDFHVSRVTRPSSSFHNSLLKCMYLYRYRYICMFMIRHPLSHSPINNGIELHKGFKQQIYMYTKYGLRWVWWSTMVKSNVDVHRLRMPFERWLWICVCVFMCALFLCGFLNVAVASYPLSLSLCMGWFLKATPNMMQMMIILEWKASAACTKANRYAQYILYCILYKV